MTKEHAKILFPYQEDDDLHELWEEAYFKTKNYFLTRSPLPLVWRSKLKRLKREYTAYLVLTDHDENTSIDNESSERELSFPENFIECYHLLQNERAKAKRSLTMAETPEELDKVIDNWMDIEISYANHWALPSTKENDIKIAQSQEPDPMELLKALQEVKEKINSDSLNTLKENYNILPKVVQKEVKRLTLLSKN